ncbi:MAG TPA: amino acid adenylation domain-containing protein [Ktedonobacteraceae bacterium]|nr:amino acid adenylation domain-containing protein [Ktedonobacteraceae bacterium]
MLLIETDNAFEISIQQKKSWFLQSQQSLANRTLGAFILHGMLDEQTFFQATQRVVEQHEIFHTVFQRTPGLKFPRQVIADSAHFTWRVLPLDDTLQFEDVVEQIWQEEEQVIFDLNQGPLLRMTLLERAGAQHLLVINISNLCADTKTMYQLLTTILRVYHELSTTSCVSEPAEDVIQYADFTGWQSEIINEMEIGQPSGEKEDGVAPTLFLEQTFGTRERRTLSQVPFTLNARVLACCKDVARRYQTTEEVVLLTCWYMLLHRLSGQTKIVQDYLDAGRPVHELQEAMGIFEINLPLFCALDGDVQVAALLVQLAGKLAQARQEQDAHLQTVKETLEHPTGKHPFSDIAFRYNVLDLEETQDALTFSLYKEVSYTHPCKLMLSCTQTQGKLLGAIHYDSSCYELPLVQAMVHQLETLVEQIAEQQNVSINALDGMSERGRQSILNSFSTSSQEIPVSRKTLHRLFEEQVEKTPHYTAIVSGERSLTFAECNARANQLGHYLRAKGVGPDTLVGLFMEKSLDLVVGMLGVLKAGGAYYPLDVDAPKERLSVLLNDGDPVVVLTQEPLQQRLPVNNIPVICLDTDWSAISRESQENPEHLTQPEHLAYVISTSGTTGKPKGVLIQHQSVVHLLAALRQNIYAPLSPFAPLRIAVNGPFTFDTSVKQIIQLLDGHTLYLVSTALRLDPEGMLNFLRDNHIDVIDCTPSQLTLWIAAGLLEKQQVRPRAILIGGEAIPLALWQQLRQVQDMLCFNVYGPTECTVDATACLIQSAGETPSIGRPLPHVRAYILDTLGRPVPIGVAGELCIGGAGVARGYLHDQELTVRKFSSDPFAGSESSTARLYHTGDSACYRPDGTIMFLGRIDRQVKVRGYRVELAEIEATLSLHPAVQEVAVLMNEDAHLSAYIVPQRNEQPEVDDLRTFLLNLLPDYMVPASFIVLEHLPLTSYGKIDYRALSSMKDSGLRPKKVFVAPRTPVEQLLADIWSEVIGREKVSIHDSFFELGGDSIMCIQVTARAKQRGLRITPIQIFQHQTIAALAAIVGTEEEVVVEQTAVTGPVPLTPIQLRFFERNLQNPHHWNQSVLLELPQYIPLPLLQQAVRHLVEHHDALRLRFSKEGKYWMQINAASEDDMLVSLHDLSTIPAYEQPSKIEQITAAAQTSLDITKGPLLRFVYLFLGTGKNDRLFIAIHHLAVDGVSWRILLEDLETLVNQLLQGQEVKLPRKTTSYRAWAGHLLQYVQSSEVQGELAYWKEQYRPTDSQIPRDYTDRPNTMDTTEQVVVKLSEEETQLLLQDVLPLHRTQMHEVLLAALLAAVTRWSGSSSLLVGMEGHGREGAGSNLDLTRTVGWFTSVFPLLLKAQPERPIGEVLRTVKDQVRAIPNKGVGYGLLRYLNLDRASATLLAELPAAEIGFNYLGQFDQTIKQAQLMIPVEEPCGPDVSPLAERTYLLELDASILNNQLSFYWTYSQNVHQRSTIDMLTQTFLEELRQLVLDRTSYTQRMVAPSDFPLAQVTQEQLDAILKQQRCVEDLYPVSLVQKGMLARYFQEPRYGQYLYQWSFDLASDLDAQLLIQAWREVIDRHAALRTAFVHEQTDEPLQVIKQAVPFDILQFDWSEKSSDDRQAHERAYLRTIQEWGFSLTQAPLLDLALVRLGPGHSKLLATFSLLVVDVPSFALLVDEAFAYYHALSQSQAVVASFHSSTSSYKEYIEWMQQQDKAAAREFWQSYLANAPGIVPILRQPQPRPEERKAYNDRAEFLSLELTQALQAFAQKHQVTLATILQGVWAIFLKEYTGWSDVIFGTIVSGRPAFLEDAERRIGRFVNFLPVRLHVPDQGTFVSWIKGSQQKLFEMLQYEYISEEQIHRWCHYHPHQHLYQSLVAYETAPFEELASAPHWADVKALTIIQDPEVPLKLTGTMFDRLRITLAALSDYAETEEVEYMFQRVLALLEQVVQNPEHGLSFTS